jgi:hypothetical protein
MYLSKRAAVALLAAAVLVGSATTAVGALGDPGARHRDHDSRIVLNTSLAPSIPTDPMLLGSAAGGAPWVLRFGEATLRSNGRLDVIIRGLVIPIAPFNGTPGPVKTVDGALYCNENSTPVGTSASFPISARGDAFIRAKLSLPSTCLVPALLIHPNGAGTIYIATSGFGG